MDCPVNDRLISFRNLWTNRLAEIGDSMKSFMTKVVKVTVSAFMMTTSVGMIGPKLVTEVEASETGYEFYPTPHELNYGDGEFVMYPEVNVVYDESIDVDTKNHFQDVFGLKGKTISESQERVEGKTNVFVGTSGSNGAAETYITENYGFEAPTTHFGEYYLDTTKNDDIVILGRDSDAAFYGITTLKQIFNQTDGSAILRFTMHDWADLKMRGFIEGYYGIPWTNENRMELMRFGGDLKMTSYVFAPKDDPYHKDKWREPYPEDELARLKEMVAVGNATKCRFVWTAHPFMGASKFDPNRKEEEIQAMINKFEHLYKDAGVRQFGVLGDDVGDLDREIVVEMMQRVGEWAKSKGDVYDVVFCPQGYNASWAKDYSELNQYDAGFPENVQIFWTGQAVCKPINQETLTTFRTQNAQGKTRRAPLFWLNWPVNDINHSRMLMGDGSSMLSTDINVNDIYGAVTNPMQESEPSKVAIFQVADYGWNVASFDGNQTWRDSFKYIEPYAADELYTLAKHMSNPEPNGHGLVMPESVELAPKLRALKEALTAGNATTQQIDEMIVEFQTIIAACDGFQSKSQNEEMKKDLEPYVNSLRDLSEAVVNFLQAKKALDAEDKMAAFTFYADGQAEFKASATHTKPKLDTPEIVDPGSTELIPFAQFMEKLLEKPMGNYVSGDKQKLEITAETNYEKGQVHQGEINNIIDGRDDTHIWQNTGEEVGKYYQVNYSIPQTIYGVHILNGAAQEGKGQDTFGSAKLMYKQEGSEEWQQIGNEFTNNPERVDVSKLEIENVVAVRYECTKVSESSRWPAMREFRVSLTPEENIQFTKEVIHTKDGWTASKEEKKKMVDERLDTGTHFNVRQNSTPKDSYIEGDYFGVKLSQPITLGKIDIVQGLRDDHNDYFHKSKLQYSMDGNKWEDLPDAEFDKLHVVYDASDLDVEARYVRLVAMDTQNYWVAVREFDVDTKVVFNSRAYTNVEALKDLGANVYTDNALLEPKSKITLKEGEYVGIKLDRIHEITKIKKNVSSEDVTLEVGMNEYEMSEYTGNDPVNARYVRLINRTKNDITFDVNELSLTTEEYYPKSYLPKDSNIPIHEADKTPATNVFDGDWTTQVIYGASQNQGNHFVYDLGREIDIEKFKVVCKDSEWDFPRHAKFEISTDKKNWEPIMTLGNQDADNPGESDGSDNINFVLPEHEISYNTKEVTLEKAKKARYLRFEITRTKSGPDKWVRLQELVINDGAYIPSVNDPTFESTCLDTQNGQFGYLEDGNVSTGYIPSMDSGNMIYHVSDENAQNMIKVIQATSPISHALVEARVDGQEDWIKLGTLSQTVNEFILPKDTKVLDVRFTWDQVRPVLKEMVFGTKDVAKVDKKALIALLDKEEDTSKWTKKSQTAYQKAIESGSKVKDSEFVSQETVDGAVKAIQTAIKNHKERGDVEALKTILKEKITDKESYTVSTWRAYFNVISKIEAAVEKAEDTSKEDVANLTKEYEQAKKGLVYSPLKAEAAQFKLNAAMALQEESYTPKSWKPFNEARLALKALLETNKENPVHPNEIQKAVEALEEAQKKLHTTDSIEALIEEANEKIASGLYTTTSVNTLQQVLDKSDVKADELRKAIDALEKHLTSEDLEAYLSTIVKEDASKYTEDSYKAYEDAYNVLFAMRDTLQDVSYPQFVAAKEAFENAQKSLVVKGTVDKTKLNQTIDIANGIIGDNKDQNKYSSKSWKAFMQAYEKAVLVAQDGSASQQQVDEAQKALKAAINALEKVQGSSSTNKPQNNGGTNTATRTFVTLFTTGMVVSVGGMLALIESKRRKMDRE